MKYEILTNGKSFKIVNTDTGGTVTYNKSAWYGYATAILLFSTLADAEVWIRDNTWKPVDQG